MKKLKYFMLLFIFASACNTCHGCDDACDPDADPISLGGIWEIEGEGDRIGCADPRHDGEFEMGPSVRLHVVITSGETKMYWDQGLKPADAMAQDTSSFDFYLPDTSIPADSSLADSSLTDSSLTDSSLTDSSLTDSSLTDSSLTDSSLTDSGSADTSVADATADRYLPRDLGRRDIRPKPQGWNVQSFALSNTPDSFFLSGQAIGDCVSFTTTEMTSLGAITYHFEGTITESSSSRNSDREIVGTFTASAPLGCSVAGDFEVEIH